MSTLTINTMYLMALSTVVALMLLLSVSVVQPIRPAVAAERSGAAASIARPEAPVTARRMISIPLRLAPDYAMLPR